ncbi:MAG: Tryptophan synthase alpha chain, partial [Labilithrix sp.]|nr:Tryptophan synthase alpha chain [Labilithrix sp.]
MTKTALLLALVGSAFLAFPACSTDTSSNPPPIDEPDASTNNEPNCGRLTTPCNEGGACEGAADCASGLCRDGTCRTVTPSDGMQNGDETDVDCGGSASPACLDGKKCLAASDCQSAVCTGNICQVPSPTDNTKNGDETDLDCGGSKAPKCKSGQGCTADTDCDNVLCDTVAKKCKPPGDDDGLKNGDETGIDCGGPTTPKKCPPGQGCTTLTDCDATKCNDASKTCDAPAANDDIKNGSETDIDCGGGAPTDAKRCLEGQACEVDADCDDFCSTAKRCVTGRSCKASVDNATAGIVTCGRGETNQAGKVHESCCRSLPLPGAPALRLDKYEVTAGRFRQFIESVGPNVRKWVKDEIQADTPTGQRLAGDIPVALRDLLPASATPGEPLNLVMQVGGTVMDSTQPSVSQGCYSDAG